MHYHKIKTIFLFALPLFLTETVDSLQTYSSEFLKNALVEQKLDLMSAENLLKNYKKLAGRANAKNHSCVKGLDIWERAIQKRELWALQMRDAWSKIPAGLLQGNLVDLGMYDECVEAGGRYCFYEINPTLRKPAYLLLPRLSVCLPRGCTADDVAQLVNATIENVEFKDQQISLVSTSCAAVDSNRSADAGLRLWTIVILGIYVGFLVLCTACDLASRYYDIELSVGQLLLARLSLAKSAENILSLKSQDDDVAVIHGLRVISSAWIVLTHEYMPQFYVVNLNVFDINKWFSSSMSLIPMVGLYSVDTFFTLSGFLMASSFFKERQQNKEFNLILHYSHRYIRLTAPVMMYLLISHVFKFGSGPRYEWIDDIFIKGIRSKWWTFALYMHNFLDKSNYCAVHLWSLAVDMQLHWISPIIVLPLYKKPRVGLVILGSLILASMSVTAAIVGYNNYSAITFMHEPNIQRILETLNNVYTMPYTRATPWLLGVFLAHKVTCDQKKPSEMTLYTGWFLTLVSFAFCVLGTRSLTQESYAYNLPWEVTFAALLRPAWASAVCWIIYASVHNSAGFISSILSWKYFLPMSKVSYGIYILHPSFTILETANARNTRYFHDYHVFHSFIGHLVMATIVAFAFNLIFEAPVRTLECLIFRRRTVSKSSEITKSE